MKSPIVLSLLLSSSVFAAPLTLDPAHSGITFEIKHLMVSSVRGSFNEFTGAIDWSEKDPAQSKFDFTVKAASIDTANQKRDEHLRAPDFFDVAKYPEATFKSASVKAAGKNLYTLEGDLTIRGVTKRTKFKLAALGKVKDPFGNEKQLFQAETKLSRKDFGLTYNAALETGGVLIGDEVKLVVDLQAVVAAKK